MESSNEKLLNRIQKMKETLSNKNMSNIAGEMLVENIREQAENKFKKGRSQWYYQYSGSFNKDNVVFYEENKRKVTINHPAAKRLEYGQAKDLLIKPKKAKALSYIGNDGKRWFSTQELIPKTSFPPLGYVYNAIKKTKQEIKNRIKEVLR